MGVLAGGVALAFAVLSMKGADSRPVMLMREMSCYIPRALWSARRGLHIHLQVEDGECGKIQDDEGWATKMGCDLH